MSKIIGFPDEVNETSARVVAGGVVAMAGTAVVADQPWLMLPLVYGFAARVAAGPRLSPLGQFATRVVTPRLGIVHKFSPGPPKRFAQAVGLALSSSALMLHYKKGRPGAAKAALGVLVAAAGLEASLGVCLGCKMFALGMKLGLVPESTCRDCADIWARDRKQESSPEKQLTFN